jgi:hypothetical protein
MGVDLVKRTLMTMNKMLDEQELELRLKTMLLRKGGVLNGKDLFVAFGEKSADQLRVATKKLQDEGVLKIKGDITDSFGVFESVYVMAPAFRVKARQL